MADSEIHYIAYDPDTILQAMMTAYIEAGGDTIYGGDEKEIFLQAVLSILTQAFAGVDNALRMATLRYAQREYLEIYGENRNCPIIQAKAARATVQITTEATGVSRILPAGTAMTEDGQVIYQLTENVTLAAFSQTINTVVECTQTGSVGNGLVSGAQLQFLVPVPGVVSVFCVESAAGGQDKEDYEVYRERIRTHGLTSVTTGPAQQYEAAARAVSTEVVDANAVNGGAGIVDVYILPRSETGVEALIALVAAALSDQTARPLTDNVNVEAATPVSYTLNVKYSSDGAAGTQEAVTAAAQEYQEWQESVIGRPFNPEKLIAMLYQAGATRVLFDEGSEFDGGDVEYTPIGDSEYCKGEISLAVISA